MNKKIIIFFIILLICVAVFLFRPEKESLEENVIEEFSDNNTDNNKATIANSSTVNGVIIEHSVQDISSNTSIEITKKAEQSNEKKEEKPKEEKMAVKEIIIKVNGKELNVELENNSSSKALVEKLQKEELVIDAHDYGNFEKVGNLGFTLPTNDTEITTEPGDLILYQGNQITLYYDTNTWTFTKLGRVTNVSGEELRTILGSDDVTFTIRIGDK